MVVGQHFTKLNSLYKPRNQDVALGLTWMGNQTVSHRDPTSRPSRAARRPSWKSSRQRQRRSLHHPPTRVTPPRLTPTARLRVTLVQASVLENQLLSMQRNVVPQQIFACEFLLHLASCQSLFRFADLWFQGKSLSSLNVDLSLLTLPVMLTILINGMIFTFQVWHAIDDTWLFF